MGASSWEVVAFANYIYQAIPVVPVRIKYYVNHICSKDIKITEEQVSKFYVDHTNDFSGVDIQVAYNNIASYLFQQEMDKKTNEYILSISEKYHLDEEVKKYKKDDKDVVN